MTNKHYIFDYIPTSDGYEIGWLHEISQKNILNPDIELYYDKDEMIEDAREIVLNGCNYTNYWLDEDIILEWEEDIDRCEECKGEGTVICPTYDDPYAEELCPECNDDSDFEYELSKDK